MELHSDTLPCALGLDTLYNLHRIVDPPIFRSPDLRCQLALYTHCTMYTYIYGKGLCSSYGTSNRLLGYSSGRAFLGIFAFKLSALN